MATRLVLVTGANKGIGFAICKKLLVDRGCHVLLGSRDAARGNKAVADLVSQYGEKWVADQVSMLQIDVTSDASVAAAAETVKNRFGGAPPPLYAIVNNAGVGFGQAVEDCLAINVYGVKRVCDHFIPLLDPSQGRIANVASASGPMFVGGLPISEQNAFTNRNVTWEEIDAIMKQRIAAPKGPEPYGLSKACLNLYTMYLARTHLQLKINSLTPGFIDTDLTAGMGATNPPDKGTEAVMHCLFAEQPGHGWFYGSDAVRSPLDRYRNPGDPPYVEET